MTLLQTSIQTAAPIMAGPNSSAPRQTTDAPAFADVWASVGDADALAPDAETMLEEDPETETTEIDEDAPQNQDPTDASTVFMQQSFNLADASKSQQQFVNGHGGHQAGIEDVTKQPLVNVGNSVSQDAGAASLIMLQASVAVAIPVSNPALRNIMANVSTKTSGDTTNVQSTVSPRDGSSEPALLTPQFSTTFASSAIPRPMSFVTAPSAISNPLVESEKAGAESGEIGLNVPANSTSAGQSRSQIAPLQQSHAPQAAQQIATAVVRSQGGTTEIALNPEELGRVRMALTTSETGVSVSIIAERQETADLMRRNLELLAREFRELGYDQVSFSFGNHQGGSDGEPDKNPDSEASPESLGPDAQHPQSSMTVALSGGLDLKL